MYDFLDYMYPYYPRKMLTKYQILVSSSIELRRFLTMYAKNGRVSTSIYDTPEDHKDIHVNRLVMDFDTPQAFEHVKNAHKYCQEKNYEHFMVFSGGGFHFYIKAFFPHKVKDQKASLINAYEQLEKEMNVVCDPSLKKGALTHCLSIPTTFNSKPERRKYVIFVTEEDLLKGYEHIVAMANTPYHPFTVYGQDFLDLGKYEATAKLYNPPVINTIPSANLPKIDNAWLFSLPTYMVRIFTDPSKVNHWSRFIGLSYLRNMGYSEEFAYQVAKEFWSKIPHNEAGNQFQRVLQKGTIKTVFHGKIYNLPSEETLRKEGLTD